MCRVRFFMWAYYLFCGLLAACSNTDEPDPVIDEIPAISWEVTGPTEHNYLLDQNAGMGFHEDNLYMLGGGGAMWNSADDNQWNGWAMRKGGSIDDLELLTQPLMAANFPYYRTEGNEWCFYWLMGLWIDQSTGWFYSIAYSEYNYLNNWESEAKERRMGLAISEDEGQTWKYTGDIITQDKLSPPPANQQYYGVGDISFFLPGDGYAYVYYKKGFYSLETLHRTAQDICVARCKLDDKLESGKWRKFYNGTWSEPGLGGKESVVIPYVNIANVAYNEYLNKYVCLGNAVSGKTFISFASDMGTQDWTERDFSFPDITEHYNWQVNMEDSNPYRMARAFRLYTTGLNTAIGQREGYHYTVTFHKNHD